MASQPASGSAAQVSPVIRDFCVRVYSSSGAARFGLDIAALEQIVVHVVVHWNTAGGSGEVRDFLNLLRVEELVLARACAAGNEAAWEYFLGRYRATLYGAAHKIAHDDATARELADSIYADLYGVSDTGRERASKLMYYSGRGSLEGWLRTVVAQEFVNRFRKTRRETSLEEVTDAGMQLVAPAAPTEVPADARLEVSTREVLQEMDAEDRLVLAAYYLDGHTLAQIARLLHVHESTISRRLERTTSELRKRIRKKLMNSGMSARQAEEALQDSDVRDLRVPVRETLRQGTQDTAFYQREE